MHGFHFIGSHSFCIFHLNNYGNKIKSCLNIHLLPLFHFFLHIWLYMVCVRGVAYKLLFTFDRLEAFSNEFLADFPNRIINKKVMEFGTKKSSFSRAIREYLFSLKKIKHDFFFYIWKSIRLRLFQFQYWPTLITTLAISAPYS